VASPTIEVTACHADPVADSSEATTAIVERWIGVSEPRLLTHTNDPSAAKQRFTSAGKRNMF